MPEAGALGRARKAVSSTSTILLRSYLSGVTSDAATGMPAPLMMTLTSGPFGDFTSVPAGRVAGLGSVGVLL